MKIYNRIITLIFTLFLIHGLNSSVIAQQTCGFGCLGLSGVYGGYTYQKHDARVLNFLLNSKIHLNGFSKNKISFEEGKGYRGGANIVRARFNGIFLSAKGFYQFLREEQTEKIFNSSEFTGAATNYNYKLKINYWGFGVDVGFPIFSFLDLKLLEGGLNFYNIDLFEKVTDENGSSEIKYENKKNDLGYYVGSGLIIRLVGDYISIEGTAQYNIFSIDEFNEEGGDRSFSSENQSLISNKSITYTVQLNIGLPL
ncbi:MAG: hypothetical protein JEY94_12255 [Melioribacteraceae bacterium]|nr:hypothetical protein [Melioribacteraceae bacterium]